MRVALLMACKYIYVVNVLSRCYCMQIGENRKNGGIAIRNGEPSISI